MSDFNNRIAAQRTLLQLVNARSWGNEELFGLSRKAIERWISINWLDADCVLINLIYRASEQLYFLANNSQEQMSESYMMISDDFTSVLKAIETEIDNTTLLST